MMISFCKIEQQASEIPQMNQAGLPIVVVVPLAVVVSAKSAYRQQHVCEAS